MKIDCYEYTNKGSRDHNEDFIKKKHHNGRFMAVVCDGLGGHNCGEVASEAAGEYIINELAAVEDIQPAGILDILQRINTGLMETQAAEPEYNGMRTTAVGCVICEKGMYYFNVGDSRFYYFSNGIMTKMTKDHSLPQMNVDAGRITFDEIRNHPDRNRLLRVLGESEQQNIGTVYTPPIQCKTGDAFLLCSDGFWEYVLEDEMEIDLSKSETARDWVEYMLIRLLLRADVDNDNYSVICGMIK